MKPVILFSSAALGIILLLLTHLTACAGPSYYAQAISGHLGLMRSREPVSDLLADSATDPELAQRLRLADQILVYASEQLGLDGYGSYNQVVITGKKAVTWNVVAAEEFSISPRTWCFPVSGCVPYRGYFKQAQATKFSDKMKRKSLDVMISPAVAYSTLGWFDDPLLDTMFQYSDAQLAGIMFHELAHQKLYVKSDTAFSESFASFVEDIGVRLWMTDTDQAAALQQWENRNLAAQDFNELLKKTRLQLQEIYASEQSETLMREAKQQAFRELRIDYEASVENDWNGQEYFSAWMSSDLNNAHLALMDSYAGGTCAFTELFEQSGQNLDHFYSLAEEKSRLGKEQRREWLQLPCKGIASSGDL
jgi:predicted aminopeptidase